MGDRGRIIDVRCAAEHNLQDVDVEFGPGITAVVGVSGSGKSSLAFDTVYHEAHRRFLETLVSGSQVAMTRAADVRSISGLGPAVSIAQNVLNRNPASTVATAIGAHVFLRILYSRFSTVRCAECKTDVRVLSEEERVAIASTLSGPVTVPLVHELPGEHTRLLGLLSDQLGRDAIAVDGKPWSGRPLAPAKPHTIVITTGELPKRASAARVRAELANADSWGCHEVVIAGRSLLRSPICPGCGGWMPRLESMQFRDPQPNHTIAGHVMTDVLAMTPSGATAFLAEAGAEIGTGSQRIVAELTRRLAPVVSLGLDHLTLDRSMTTLSRGESQRVRLAVVLSGRLEDLLHVLDEPSIGLHRRDVDRLFGALGDLPGPVVMVEHDAAAVANADDVVEIGPNAGPDGGRLVYQGTPAVLWETDTVSGRFFSGRNAAVARTKRAPSGEFIDVCGAHDRNLQSIDVRIPLGLLTVVTGPSGAGKTTLVRDVLLASITSGTPVGCETVEAPPIRARVVDQSPIGNNPRSNAATYTKVFDAIRDVFAKLTGESPSLFTFNRAEGACAQCEGMGAVEVRGWFASTWVECDACEGRRYKPEALEQRIAINGRDLTIADALELSVDEALALFADERAVMRPLTALTQVGLGYLKLGQPSPTLSGGEAQRVRLAKELARAKAGDLVVLDEPTTGLHPADLARFVAVLDGLTEKGCTVVVIEHQPDVTAAADWIIDLGPGGGPDGGRLVHCGVPPRATSKALKPRKTPRRRPRSSDAIRVRGAAANNLQRVDVDIPKGKFTAVTGVSGSGKSSLVRDVIEAEATRRLLECLSMYERQSVREGPEAPIDSLDGLGPTLAIGAERRAVQPNWMDYIGRRTRTVGSVSEIAGLTHVLLARAGVRTCLECGGAVVRTSVVPDKPWKCDACGIDAVPIESRLLDHWVPTTACPTCGGFGVVRVPDINRVILAPDKPLAAGATRIQGFFRDYFCKPGTAGFNVLNDLAARYDFDPKTTLWNELPPATQEMLLHGDPDKPKDAAPWMGRWPGLFFGSSWDHESTWTTPRGCEGCNGKRVRPEYLTITLDGYDRSDIHTMPLSHLADALTRSGAPDDELAAFARQRALQRLEFLRRVGLGYLHLDRLAATLSAGEAQRVKLASVLGSGLLGMTVLLDEPSRGLHPLEVDALVEAVEELRDAGNTVVAVEHDGRFLVKADHVIEIGPSAGSQGGTVMYEGPVGNSIDATQDALRAHVVPPRDRRAATGRMEVFGAGGNNLRIPHLRVPLGVLVGVCGVSGSGKSSLFVDTVGMKLVRHRSKNPVIEEQYEPGVLDRITDAPPRTVIADQSRVGIATPGHFLGLIPALRRAYAECDEALAAGLEFSDFQAGCSACRGTAYVSVKMGFLPDVSEPCDVCDGTGYRAEVRGIATRGRTLPEVEARTIEDLAEDWGDVPAIARVCDAVLALGAGYITVRQPAMTLSGGEAQRLKLAAELGKRTKKPSLYLLDEPTTGLHVRDVKVLAHALHEVVDAGHSVIVLEHDMLLLAECDWLIELGPGAGPEGGRVIAEGTPEDVASMPTPTAPFLRSVMS